MSAAARTEPTALEWELCAVLSSANRACAAEIDAESARSLLGAARGHGVAELLADAWVRQAALEGWPGGLLDRYRQILHLAAAVELLREGELREVLKVLAGAQLPAVLMKGTPLAYTHYRDPALRPRCDTDLLVRPEDAAAVEESLVQAGYTTPNATHGDLVSHQRAWSRGPGGMARGVLDIHWRINNNAVFAQLLHFAEVTAESVPVPALGGTAMALCPVHALLLACAHRAGHLGPERDKGLAGRGDRLLWLYDIHLLVAGLSAAEADRFVALAQEKKVCAVCLDALEQCRDCFGTEVPEPCLEGLRAVDEEASAELLAGTWSARMRGNLAALPGWRARLRLLWEMAIPPGDYVLRKYGLASRLWLPFLYLRRAVTGVGRLLGW